MTLFINCFSLVSQVLEDKIKLNCFHISYLRELMEIS